MGIKAFKQEAETQLKDYSKEHWSISKKLKIKRSEDGLKADPYSALAEVLELKRKLDLCVRGLITARSVLESNMVYLPELDNILAEVGKEHE